MQSIYRLESNMADRGRFDEMVERYVQATEFIDTNAEDARKLSLEVIKFALIPDDLDDLVEDSALIYVDDIDEAKARYDAAFTAEFQYKTIIHGRTTIHTYTAADVLDACFAQSCAEIAAAEHTSTEAVATADCESYDENNVLDPVETKRLRAAMLARLENGQNVLDEAKLVQSRRFVNGCARYHLQVTIAPVVLIPAGHIAYSEASREATLRAK